MSKIFKDQIVDWAYYGEKIHAKCAKCEVEGLIRNINCIPSN